MQPDSYGCDHDEGEEVRAQLVIARGYTAEPLELVKETFDEIAFTIDDLLPSVLLFAVGAIWDVGNGPLSPDMSANAVGVVALVCDDDGSWLKTIEQRFSVRNVVDFAGRDQEPDRAAFGVDARVDLRGEAPSASPHTTISTLFLTPEAC